ncbi:carbohydrate porin [Rhodobium gokarnense]|uniref:Porin n=1 Tax=Rhodobium gokarnense TaxID=364296 RepID=A0ABT3HC74_9HYPH|nr:carbohydrate porin [Rhodobium gokarnense]MCW2308004.1 porin [Rhodobium gokarnense]
MTSFTRIQDMVCARVAARPGWTFAVALALTSVVFSPQTAIAEEATPSAVAASAGGNLSGHPLNGPESADSLLTDSGEEKQDLLDRNVLQEWEAWKAAVTEKTGLSFGADYTIVGFGANTSLGDRTAVSGIARIYGSWALFNRGAANTGSIEFKGENRHSFTDTPPQLLGLAAGYVGVTQPVFSDQRFRTTTLYWKQRFLEDRAVARLGLVDVKEYFDVFALGSPWSGFQNLVFSTGANTIAILPDGAFGGMAGGYLTDHIYSAVGIADASADPTSAFQSFETFFSDFDTFKTFEIGLTGGGKLLFVDNAHISFWHMDDIARTGAPGGWGVIGSASKLIDGKWLAFLRGGWAHEGGGLYEASVSTGFGYMPTPAGNLLGVGVNWGRPNRHTLKAALDDQWTGEVFYRVQVSENFQVTPSVQLLGDPALNPDKDLIALFGLRSRVTF